METKPRWQSTTILAVLVWVLANVLSQSWVINLDTQLQADIVGWVTWAITVISWAVAIYWRIISKKNISLK